MPPGTRAGKKKQDPRQAIWQEHTTAHSKPLYLEGLDKEEQTNALITFAVTIRSGKYGNKNQVTV